MKSKEIKSIVVIVIVALAIALIINLLLSSDYGIIPSEFSKKEWFGFWTSYTTGILAIIIGYLTIFHTNANSKQALLHQNSIIIRQESNEIQKEITEEIKAQNSLFNLVRFTSTLLCMNEDDLPKAREKVLENKATVAERQIQWTIIRNLYLNSPSIAPIAEEYNKVWDDAATKLEAYTNLEMEVFRAIDEEIIAEKNLINIDKLLKLLNGELKSKEVDQQMLNEISNLEKQKLENAQKQYEARQNLKSTVKKLQESIAILLGLQDVVFTASIKFLSQINSFVFVGDKRPKDV